MAFTVRRILTAHDPEGRSIVGTDTVIQSQPGKMQASIDVANVWINETMPPVLDGADPTKGQGTTTPHPQGTIFRILEIPPGNDTTKHKTDTIDYYVILQGELYMTLDIGEVLCKEGDVIVQRSTNHGWDNRSGKPAMFAEMLIDAKGK